MVSDGKIHMLDLAAKLDSTAEYLCKLNWGDVEFPPPFGRDALPEVVNSPFILRLCSYLFHVYISVMHTTLVHVYKYLSIYHIMCKFGE